MTESPLAWDYTGLARHYDRRPDYSGVALDRILELTRPDRDRPIADIGAGTAKLARMVVQRGYSVVAVEPNHAMAEIGRRNTVGLPLEWKKGTAEATGLDDGSFDLVTFGSSFNVTDCREALKEVARILRPHGWMACMWNLRDLDDPLQQACERIIFRYIPGYVYGSRREDQTGRLRESGLFGTIERIEETRIYTVTTDDFLEAWRSHATLASQAGCQHEAILGEIATLIAGRPTLEIPYTTRAWCARLT